MTADQNHEARARAPEIDSFDMPPNSGTPNGTSQKT